MRRDHCTIAKAATMAGGRLDRAATLASRLGNRHAVAIWMSARGSHFRRIQGYRRTQRELAQRPS